MVSATMYAAVDWADRWLDCAVIARDGTRLGFRRVIYKNTSDPVAEVQDLLRSCNRTRWRTIPIGTEDPDGLVFQAMEDAGLTVVGIEPMLAARTRKATTMGLTKSDRADAYLLADMLRTGGDRFRPVPRSSPEARAVRVLARAQVAAVKRRSRALHQLRAVLVTYYPAAVTAWPRLTLRHAQARAVLAAAPTPARAAALSRTELAGILRDAGRWRTVDDEAERLSLHFRRPALRTHPMVEAAKGVEMRAVLDTLDHACDAAVQLSEQVAEAFGAHADALVLQSFPGIGPLLGARILGEIGDEPGRFATARNLCAYAGVVPVVWASGLAQRTSHRRFANETLREAIWQAAFCSLTKSPGAAAFYRRRREGGESHNGALRNLAARLLRALHHCMATHRLYDETLAFRDIHPAESRAG
ncbi:MULTISPECIES: IS110 family transposase [unclassified Streptomyces]|uniref:IS110 family transposase n=1 Tax=unclassified Streptomyces TaxID=2593676 RepID=UPI00081AFBF1|nr:IS110 family transposase [Streptomyces sp. DvalAA-43]MYQ82556.1 IS110 family transposase [Streptomyces sp. SID4936]SCD44436.1 Transposase IS116/IS110/IS902 family protein [Streptomyces sp. DvalAA-43]